MGFKIGFSYDVHRFNPNRKLVLGGVEIEHYQGLLGHSDADCLTHVIVEAIIGALGLGDLGTHFPDTDELYRDASSLLFLEHVKNLLAKEHYTVANIDATICIEKPRISEYRMQMQNTIANVLGIEPGKVNIKATRGERLGFVGSEEGVACYAVVLIENNEPKIVKLKVDEKVKSLI